MKTTYSEPEMAVLRDEKGTVVVVIGARAAHHQAVHVVDRHARGRDDEPRRQDAEEGISLRANC